jgi:hypothetical protein
MPSPSDLRQLTWIADCYQRVYTAAALEHILVMVDKSDIFGGQVAIHAFLVSEQFISLMGDPGSLLFVTAATILVTVLRAASILALFVSWASKVCLCEQKLDLRRDGSGGDPC